MFSKSAVFSFAIFLLIVCYASLYVSMSCHALSTCCRCPLISGYTFPNPTPSRSTGEYSLTYVNGHSEVSSTTAISRLKQKVG